MHQAPGTVLVTGGTKRIGKAICDVLRARGWNVLVHGRGAGAPLAADFDAPSAPARLFAQALACAPGLCAVVNNAALFSTARALAPDAAARLLRVNAEAPDALVRLLGAHLARAGRTGAAVNLLDARILAPPVGAPTPYEASKRALADATRRAARACAPALRVNAVAPGPVLAPADAANREKGGAVLLGRRPTPEDVAEAVAFLLEAPSVTGQILAVDAGQALARAAARDAP